jgi:hypothetical protein
MIAVAFGATALAVLGLVVLLLVLIGIRREAPWTALDDEPPTPLAGFARAVLGVYVRKSTDDQKTKPAQTTALVKERS